MYKDAFDRVLNSTNIPRAVYFYGDSDFLIELYISKYLAKVPKGLSELRLYHSEFDLDLAKNHLNNPSLFDDGNLLVIKYNKKLDAKSINALLDLVEKNSFNYLLLYYNPEEARDAKAKADYFAKRSSFAVEVRFFEPNFYEAKTLIKSIAKEREIELDDSIADQLLRLNDFSLALSISELEKIAVLDDKSAKNIESVVAGHLAVDPFKIVQFLIEKKQVWHMIENLFLDGFDETRITADLNRNFLQIFMFFVAKKIGASSKDFLGYQLPTHIENERASIAIRLTLEKYTAIFEVLSQIEKELKTSGVGDKKAVLYAGLIKLQSKIL